MQETAQAFGRLVSAQPREHQKGLRHVGEQEQGHQAGAADAERPADPLDREQQSREPHPGDGERPFEPLRLLGRDRQADAVGQAGQPRGLARRLRSRVRPPGLCPACEQVVWCDPNTTPGVHCRSPSTARGGVKFVLRVPWSPPW